MAKEQGILTESGTNEMELLVFTLKSTPFGVNVAKVREIIQRSDTNAIPYSHPAVDGTFKLRNRVLTQINLGRHFAMEGEQTRQGEGMTIIIEFNNIRCGILVDSVERIFRLRWDDIQPPSHYLINLETPITGVVNLDDKVVLIADFETIIGKILGIQSIETTEEGEDKSVSVKDAHILLVDDSAIVRKSLVRTLNQHGYKNLTVCTDGQHAWETIQQAPAKGEDGLFDLVLSDIEMPQMDGFHLTSKIKSNPELKKMPVILFSSLISKDNHQKGISVGADAQIAKPNSQEMVKVIETFLTEKKTLATATA